MHTTLERLFDLPAHERDVEAARGLFATAWTELADTDAIGAAAVMADAKASATTSRRPLQSPTPWSRAFTAARHLLRSRIRRGWSPHAREVAVSVEITEGFSIRGFIDRVDRAPAGQIRIVDYKSGKAPRAGFESKAMFQMRFYALAWWRLTG